MKKRVWRYSIVFCIVLSLITCNMSITTAHAGNTANELVAVAKRELGNGYSKYTQYVGPIGGRYDYAWCAAFVSWCGNQGGVSCIGKTASCKAQYDYMLSHGAKSVDTPQAGDVVFFYCNSCSGTANQWCHIGIMIDSATSIDGNYNNRVAYDRSYSHYGSLGYKHSGGISKIYVRPNYGQASSVLPGTIDSSWSVPANVTASHKIATYDQWGNAESNHYIDPGDSCYVAEVYTNGFVKVQYPVSGGTRWAYAKASDFSLSKKSVVTFGTPLNIGTNFYAYIQNPNAGKCLTNDNQNVSVRTYSETNAAQVWKFERQSDGSYKIINNKDGLLLDVLDSGTTDYTNVQVWKDNGADAQRWFVYSNGNAYLLRAKCADLVLDVYGAGTAEGTNVELYTPNGTNAQVFSIIKTEQVVTPSVEYSVHVQDKGWTDYVSNGTTAGTTGKSLQMEAIKIKVNGMSGDIVYRTHVEDYGWMSNKSSGSISGTTGKNLQIEAIQIYLTGKISESYDVYYRAHIADFGWLGWTKNGETAGSTECALQMEAIQIKLCPKNSSITTSQSSIGFPQLSYKAHVSDIGRQNYVSEGTTAGTTGRSLQMEALEISCKDFFGGSGIQYCAHVADVGWQDWKNSDTIAGTTGQNKKMEAIKIKLSGYIANYFDVYYRVHCADYGWLGWACNGESAGTTGGSKQMEAIQIKIIRKGNGFDKGGTAYYDLSSSGGQSSSSSFDPIWPCEKTYKVTTLYRYSSGGLHSTRFQYGIDIGASKGENVLAVEAGTVIKSEYSTTSGFGNWIMIQHDNGKVSLYAHLNRRNVSKGDKVAKGQVIGQVGNTSAKYRIASHLHFELGNSSRSGASGDAWQEYYKAKYADKVEVCCTETK